MNEANKRIHQVSMKTGKTSRVDCHKYDSILITKDSERAYYNESITT